MNTFCVFSVSALPSLPFNAESLNSFRQQEFSESQFLKGGLHEVPPPPVVEKIRKALANHHPQLSLLAPSQGEILFIGVDEQWQLVFNLKDWPLVENNDFGLGPHLVVQVDDDKPIRISHSEGTMIVLTLDGLSPGTHRIAAYLAFPWGEALKDPGTNVESRISFFKETQGKQPSIGQPWLTVVSPSKLSFKEPLLIDSLIWNAPLQGLDEGDDRWRLEVNVNGDIFLMDRQEAIWVKGIDSDRNVVQFQLLDNIGEPIDPVFNNQLRVFHIREAEEPPWLNPNLSQSDLLKLIGEKDVSDPTLLLNEQNGEKRQLVLPTEKDDPSIAKYDLIFPSE